MTDLMSTGQAAELLGMSTKAVREAARSGLIDCTLSTTPYGQPVYVFERAAIECYRAQRVANLRACLAKLEAAAG